MNNGKQIFIIAFLAIILKIVCTKENFIIISRRDLDSYRFFYDFLSDYVNLLRTSFPEKKLVEYCRIVSSCLSGLDYKYARKFHRYVKRLCRSPAYDIKEEVISYRYVLDQELPNRISFLSTMDELFTIDDRIMFKDYVNDLKDFGYGDKLYIYKETHRIIYEVILDNILNRSENHQNKLATKLKRAIKEYNQYTS